MYNPFEEESFHNGCIKFTVQEKPVSSQNKNKVKVRFKESIREVTSTCEFLITSTCWVDIEYYCSQVHRFKNPGVYDMDNIIKPILDGITGNNGLILDDVLFDRVIVNWIDTEHDHHFDINLEYPTLSFQRKDDLVLVKSGGGWCLPVSKHFIETEKEIIKVFFENWSKINNLDDYYQVLYGLPHQRFVHYSKVKDKDYSFVELAAL